MKKVLLILMLTISSLLYSQISINSTDITSAYGVSTVLNMHIDTLNFNVNIGQLGSTSWNFSNLVAHISFTDTSVSLNSTPYANLFPGSTHALHARVVEQDTVPADLYQYLSINPGAFVTNGAVTTANILGSSFVIKRTNSPGEITLQLPLTFGTNWEQIITVTNVTEIGGIPFITTTENNTSSYVVDAYGSMTLPGGQTVDALRLKKDEKTYNQGNYERQTHYLFVSKEGYFVQLTADDTLQSQTGIIATEGVTWSGPTAVGVKRDKDKLEYNFALNQNYPNPFNPSTMISFEVDKESFVELRVFNVIGKEAAVLVYERLSPGSYDVQFDAKDLTAGIYFARLTAGGVTKTIKMTLLK